MKYVQCVDVDAAEFPPDQTKRDSASASVAELWLQQSSSSRTSS